MFWETDSLFPLFIICFKAIFHLSLKLLHESISTAKYLLFCSSQFLNIPKSLLFPELHPLLSKIKQTLSWLLHFRHTNLERPVSYTAFNSISPSKNLIRCNMVSTSTADPNLIINFSPPSASLIRVSSSPAPRRLWLHCALQLCFSSAFEHMHSLS